MNTCLFCHKTTEKQFCSRSCRTSYYMANPTPAILASREKRKKTNACQLCGTSTGRRSKYCIKCRESILSLKDMTLKDGMYNHLHKSSSFAKIRTRARAVFAKTGISACQKCGYDKHIEVCHIRPISDFAESDLISIINAPTNLVGLCPNCHWEFDNGLLLL